METTISVIGQMIKELRSKRGMTLDEVAERSGCTPGFISQVERNKAVPSVTTLYSIAHALGVRVTEFFPDPINTTKVTRRDARENFHFEGSQVVYSRLTTKLSYGALEAFVMTFKPADEALPTDESRAHIGEEYVYVLEGVLRLWIADTSYDLYAGDLAYFKPTVSHRLENRSGQPVVAIGLITPSLF